MFIKTIKALFAAVIISASASAQFHIGPGGHFLNLNGPIPVPDAAAIYSCACDEGSTWLNGWFDPSTLTPEQNAFLRCLVKQEQPGVTDPNNITPLNANQRGDKDNSGFYNARGPFQMWRPYVYDSSEYNPGLGMRINDSPTGTGLGGPTGPVNDTNWRSVERIGCWENLLGDEPIPTPQDELDWDAFLWWTYNCGIVVNYFDRYGGSAWEDLNSDDPQTAHDAVEKLAKIHNGGPGAPNARPGTSFHTNVTNYANAVESHLRQHYPGVISGLN